MGKMSELSIEIEEAESTLESLINELKSIKNLETTPINLQNNITEKILTLKGIQLDLSHLVKLGYYSIVEIINKRMQPYVEYLMVTSKSLINFDIIKLLFTAINSVNKDIQLEYDRLNGEETLLEEKNSINSKKYYSNKIKELEQKEMILKKELEKSKNTTSVQRIESKKIEDNLFQTKKELQEQKKALEVWKAQDDAKNDWEQKINNTFKQLKTYLAPITQEHNRLKILYYSFAILTFLTLGLIICSEVNIISKMSKEEGLPSFNDYLLLFLPIPIAGALMWGFVFQMNRAQRQLMLIANKIHNINYIQGLLIATNNLSPNVNDSIQRINVALDKVISNHLNNKNDTTESELIKEENKDNMDIDKLTKLINVIKANNS